MPLVALDDVTRIYRMGDSELRALDHVSLTVEAGEFVAIMGASGSGKSTLMNVIGCLDRPTSGRCFLDGEDTGQLSPDELAELRNRTLGFVFQHFNLLARTSALENVELPLVYADVPRREREERARDALELVGLGTRLHHAPNELSGGQQQRVAIARALVTRPRLLLADEPTGNLDSRTSVELMALFQAFGGAGLTIVLVTHEPDVAAYAKRVLHMRDGRIRGDERQVPRIARVERVPEAHP
jgi:putative ABC transport system ATP-binding protein